MKVKETIATEWRKSPFDPSASGIDTNTKIADSSFVTNINIGSLPDDTSDVDHGGLDIIRYDYSNDNRLYMVVWSATNWEQPVLAYLWIQQVVDDVWQVKEVSSTPKFVIKNLGAILVKNVIIIERVKLINDFDMSDQAENLWLNKLKDRISGIYDKELNQVYPISAVGTTTSDGVEIIHPEFDIGDPDDYTGESQRFFIILENSFRKNVIEEAVVAKREYRRKILSEEKPTPSEIRWQRADIVKRLFD